MATAADVAAAGERRRARVAQGGAEAVSGSSFMSLQGHAQRKRDIAAAKRMITLDTHAGQGVKNRRVRARSHWNRFLGVLEGSRSGPSNCYWMADS